MPDLNTQIANAVAEIDKAQSRNARCVADAVAPVNTATLAAITACQLTAEEIAAAGATIERIGIEDTIDTYIVQLQGFYYATKGGSAGVPAWLKRSGKDEEYITRFYASLDQLDTEVNDLEVYKYGTTTEQARIWEKNWNTAKEKETLSETAKDKVRQGVDLLAKLRGDLRYLGYPGTEIGVLVNV